MAEFFNGILIASLWGGVLTIVFLAVNRLLGDRLPASVRYYIWLIVLLRLAVSGVISVTHETVQTPAISEVQNIAHLDAVENDSVQLENVDDGSIVNEVTLKVHTEPRGLSAINDSIVSYSLPIKLDGLWIVWLTVAVLAYCFNILSYLLYIKKLKKCKIPPREDEQRIFESLMKERRIGSVTLFRSADTETPFVIGISNPMVVLPDKEYTPAQLNHILSHELNHVSNYDIWIKWLFETVKAIHWFNPFVYIAANRASFYCEELCDSAVLKNSDENGRKEYGHTIIDVVGNAVAPKTPFDISMSSAKADLKERIRNILDGGRKKSIAPAFIVILLALVLCAFSSIHYTEVLTPIEVSGFSDSEAIRNRDIDIPVKPAKQSTNIMIAGVDNYGLADVIMIANFNAETNKISLLSVPRDTFMPLSDDLLSKAGLANDSDPLTKLNFVMTYAGGENAMELLQSEVESLLGIHIDYYAKINMSVFERIIDAAGGVEMELLRDYYYKDPDQNLEIDLKAGMQHLDGEKALQYIRFRADYRNGDMDRIEVQRKFMAELFRKLAASNNLPEKASVLLEVLINDTETNLTMSELASYAAYISKINPDSLQTFVLPAEQGRKGMYSYMFMDDEEFEGSVAEWFRD